MLLFTLRNAAQSDIPHFDSLQVLYDKAKTIDERILITKNQLDVCMSVASLTINDVSERLYQLGMEAERHDVMLEAARNTWTKDMMQKMQRRIEHFPNSIDKRCTQLALRIDITFMENNTLTQEGREAVINKMLSSLQDRSVTDIYDRFFRLYVLCRTAYGSEHSVLLTRFLDEMVETAPRLQSKYNFLLTSAYRTAYTCYLYANNKEKAVKALYGRIAVTEKMQESYLKEGRNLRDFSQYLIRDLLLLYTCRNVLSKEQTDQCYINIRDIVRQHPQYLDEKDPLSQKINIVLAIHEGRWKDASKYLNIYVDNLDQLLNTKGVDMGEGINIPLLELMDEVYTQMGDRDRLLRTRILLTEYYRRIISNMKRFNYQHLGIRMQVLDKELENKELALRNKEKNEKNKLIELEIEQTRLKKQHQEQLSRLEQLRLDSLTFASQESQAKMRNEAQRENQKGNKVKQITISIVVGIVLITLICCIIYIIIIRQRRTKLRKMQLQLEAENERAKKSDEDRLHFLQSIRHEVGTPLNIVMGISEQLANMADGDDSDDMKLLSQMIRENGQQLMALINDILDLSLLQSGEYNIQLEDIAINNTCETLINSVQHTANKDVRLYYLSRLSDKDTLTTDPVRFRQLITNLLTNACKYTQKGTITLAVESLPDNSLQFTVTDTGIGIRKEDAERVFNRYEKLGSQKQGSGLGLNICRVIAEKLGGRIFLDTDYTDGARFVFIHPIVRDE